MLGRKHPSGFLILLLTLVALSGCSQWQHVDHSSAAEKLVDQEADWQYLQVDAEPVGHLNDLIDSPQLQALVAQALSQNPGLQQTALALRIAYAERDVSAADRLPTASAGFDAGREKDADTQFSAGLAVSWELDLWRKLGDGVRAAEMDIAGSEAGYQAARDALAANVMRSSLTLTLNRKLIAIERQRLTVQESNEAMIARRYRSGLGDLEELDSARTTSASTRATLAEYRENQASAERALRQLLGQGGDEWDVEIMADFPQVPQPLASLPDQDLQRRPDLQQAFYAIRAAEYRTDVAYKDLLPSISLSAALNDMGSSPSAALFASPAWSLLGQLTAPLFQGGRLRAQAEIAELTAEQQYWAYQETLLGAVTEVNDTLGQEQSLSEQQRHLQEAVANAQRSYDSYLTKYRQGLVDILDLLTVQQKVYDLQSRLTQVTYSRLVNRIDLGLALGLKAAA